jgi:hypothetical protein
MIEDVGLLRDYLYACIFNDNVAGEEWEDVANELYDELSWLLELNAKYNRVYKTKRLPIMRDLKNKIAAI